MANLLIADDDDNLRALMCRALKGDGHSVADASDGASALASFKAAGTIDILITDVEMPGGDGVSLAVSAASLKPDIKVVLISGFSDALGRAGEIKAKAVETLEKPFALEKLREIVSRLASA